MFVDILSAVSIYGYIHRTCEGLFLRVCGCFYPLCLQIMLFTTSESQSAECVGNKCAPAESVVDFTHRVCGGFCPPCLQTIVSTCLKVILSTGQEEILATVSAGILFTRLCVFCPLATLSMSGGASVNQAPVIKIRRVCK